MEKAEIILNIAKRRGLFYPSAEIYSNLGGFWTYGHLGTKIKHKWENVWRKFFLGLNPYFFEIDDCNILPKKVFESSGHLENFNDPLIECIKCKFRFRADEFVEDKLGINAGGLSEKALDKLIQDNKLKCPKCSGELDKVKFFNMMFDVKVGAINSDVMYLRPESAQSPYLAFKKEFEALRRRLPFGLAVIGRAFRNEISPRQTFFRLREFTQAELQIFFDPEKIDEHENFHEVESQKINVLFCKEEKEKLVSIKELHKKGIPKFYLYYLTKVQDFYLKILKYDQKKIRFRELSEKERAFYNKIHFDVEADLESLGGWKEISGVHYRADHDLSGHEKGSGESLSVGDKKKFIPHVLELSFGVDRNIWALADLFFKEEPERNLFNFPLNIVPFDVAVFPLVNKDKLPIIAKEIFNDLFEHFDVFYDEDDSIGRRYRRQDEIGTAISITCDFDTLKDQTITIRDRDTMQQVRIKISDLKEKLRKLLDGGLKFEKAGKLIN